MKKIKLFALVWFVALFMNGITSGSMVFYQSDFVLDGTTYTDTDWGSVDLTYTGSASMMYLNVAVNGSWQIQNVPVLSQEGAGVTHTKNYSFDLGVTSGTPVTSLTYDYSLTTSTVGTMPGGSTPAVVSNRSFIMSSGIEDAIATLTSAVQLIGHVVNGAGHVNSGFPNQDCKLNECTPAAVSNSFQFLNDKKKLGIDPSEMTIDKMKTATKWKVPPRTIGCYIDDNPDGNAWWKDKDAYMKAKGFPITTRKITDLSKLAVELDDDQDIELQGGWHTAAIVGLTELANGCFAIDVAHDTQQSVDGAGTMIQTILYCPTTQKFIGSPGFFHDSGFEYAVVECPEPATMMLLCFGCLLLRRRK
jgi:hypothetical protein